MHRRIESALKCGVYGVFLGAALLHAMVSTTPSWAQAIPAATYLFDDNLNAEEPGVPALTEFDPLSSNGFETATVFGDSRRVYHLDGNPSPNSEQAGLELDPTGLVTFNNYSIEIVFEFVENVSSNGWRKVFDPHGISPIDWALFVDAPHSVTPGDKLDIWFGGAHPGTTTFTDNTFHHVVVTVTNTSSVKVYLDGNLEMTLSTSSMNIDGPLGFFRDNVAEYSDARIALIRLSEGVLTDSEVTELASDPFPITNQPPDVSNASANPDGIWPPNNKMVDITIDGVSDPDGNDVTITITGIIDNEGSDPDDVDGIGTSTAQVRAQRDGKGSGRTYTIAFDAYDGQATSSGTVTVTVPHDQGKGKAKGRASKPIANIGPGASGLLLGDKLDTFEGLFGGRFAQVRENLTFELTQNYPNPFNPSTTIRYTLADVSEVRLTIYNTLGQAVRVLVNATQSAGSYNVNWDGRDASGKLVASGLYIYRLEAGRKVAVRKMIFAK